MQITAEEIYWITRLDIIHTAMLLGIAVAFVAMLAFIIHACEKESAGWAISGITLFVVTTIILGLVYIFVPTTKEMAMIKIIPAMVNSDFMQNDLPEDMKQVYSLGKQAIVDYLKGDGKE